MGIVRRLVSDKYAVSKHLALDTVLASARQEDICQAVEVLEGQLVVITLSLPPLSEYRGGRLVIGDK